MSRWLCVLVVGLLLLGGPAVEAGPRPAEGAAPDEVVGSVSWLCPALGVLTGLSLATGQWISAAGFAVTAVHAGCVV